MTSEGTLVSVVMPVYNGYPLIKNSIKSLLWQTYDQWECIIVNDGSIDQTKEYLDSLSDPRFKVIHLKENRGRGYARQVALEHVTGEFLAMLDADDWYDPQKLECQVFLMQNYPDVDLVSCGLCSYGSKASLLRVRGKGDGKVYVYHLGEKCPVCHAPSMLRTSITKGIKYNVLKNCGEDIDFINKCMVNRKYMITNDVFYYYSEFDSYTVNKIWKIFWKSYLEDKTAFNLLKCFVYSIYARIVGTNFILSNRGFELSKSEIEKFEYLCKLLTKI